MEFKEMSEMSAKEILTVLRFVQPYGQIVDIEWQNNQNFVKVFYILPNGQSSKTHRIDFLPDDIYIVPDNDVSDEKPLTDNVIMEIYHKFMIANGYSEVWLNNPFL